MKKRYSEEPGRLQGALRLLTAPLFMDANARDGDVGMQGSKTRFGCAGDVSEGFDSTYALAYV